MPDRTLLQTSFVFLPPESPWTEEPTVHGVAKSRTQLSNHAQQSSVAMKNNFVMCFLCNILKLYIYFLLE